MVRRNVLEEDESGMCVNVKRLTYSGVLYIHTMCLMLQILPHTHHARLQALKRELKIKELQVLDATRRRFLHHQQGVREAELQRMEGEIQHKVEQRERETRTVLDDIETRALELERQRILLEQELRRCQEEVGGARGQCSYRMIIVNPSSPFLPPSLLSSLFPPLSLLLPSFPPFLPPFLPPLLPLSLLLPALFPFFPSLRCCTACMQTTRLSGTMRT